VGARAIDLDVPEAAAGKILGRLQALTGRRSAVRSLEVLQTLRLLRVAGCTVRQDGCACGRAVWCQRPRSRGRRLRTAALCSLQPGNPSDLMATALAAEPTDAALPPRGSNGRQHALDRGHDRATCSTCHRARELDLLAVICNTKKSRVAAAMSRLVVKGSRNGTHVPQAKRCAPRDLRQGRA
jgi:hypothetical protein